MAGKSKPLMIRLPDSHVGAFERLSGEFGGLAPATVLRMIAICFLEQGFDEQVERIESQIRPAKKAASRLSRVHCNNRER